MKLNPQAKALLSALIAAGGKRRGDSFDANTRALASRMQDQGLVQWEAPPYPMGHVEPKIAWTLTITDAGTEALSQ